MITVYVAALQEWGGFQIRPWLQLYVTFMETEWRGSRPHPHGWASSDVLELQLERITVPSQVRPGGRTVL